MEGAFPKHALVDALEARASESEDVSGLFLIACFASIGSGSARTQQPHVDDNTYAFEGINTKKALVKIGDLRGVGEVDPDRRRAILAIYGLEEADGAIVDTAEPAAAAAVPDLDQ